MQIEQVLSQFHFLRPWWLLSVLPIMLLIWLSWRSRRNSRGWHSVIAPHLASLLVTSAPDKQSATRYWALPLALLLFALGSAGPTWQRIPQPVYQLDAGQVVVLDMSLSMRATDVAPNRLTQLRYKAMQLASEHLDGDTGLIAYAGDAFVISPLTADASSLGNLIRALSPEIMPSPGSDPISALNLADRLLREAGYPQGDIYWFTDGIDTRDQQELTRFVRNHPHRLAVLAVGTEQGAPIELETGKLLRNNAGDVVIPRLTPTRLEQLAELSNGRFSKLRQDPQDIAYLAAMDPLSRDGKERDDQRGDAWYDLGPWLIIAGILLLLPMIRRGSLLLILFSVTSAVPLFISAPAAAQTDNDGLAWHEQLWQTPYQQTDQALKNEDYQRAAEIAEDAWQRGTANYRAGRYEQALTDFSQVDNAQGYYNQGNSLMQLERYDEAANAYAEALNRDPDFTQAQENLALAERQAEQQRQQQQQQQGDGQQQQQQDGDGEPNDGDAAGTESSAEPGDTSSPPESESQDPQQGQKPQPQESKQPAEQPDSETPPSAQGPSAEQLSEEQRQQMEQWLNRIDDNPAFLLQRKMLEETKKRRTQQRPPQGVQKQW
ncbi:hypothetical protein PSI9734_00131 [Pseudidiomarina piscicola]|uniref:VWFA domain-containing protein n=1 Tax=Pseudidiomarina piscicola TaxID=2614830 RepID=A0A6Y9WJH7_9GAMM|nr:VWA domain-containing protein [Pseudidiomarina piscicola]CAB0149561.1 hypothetical protein PSI9734_00131 [Pseudidiomarina piscicola]VZT39009.1 hypothetical protein PSI9734_00131 [Pseudomonas aeruginosa]